MNPQQIIDELNLLPHPEGGYYKEVYRSESSVYSERAKDSRAGVTDIYFMLTKGQVSRFHKVVHDEIWHFYTGAPLKLIEISSGTPKEIILGDYNRGINCKHTICGGNWQAAESMGEFSLMGCTVAPGFDFRDFSFLSDSINTVSEIRTQFPEYLKYI